MSRTSVTLKSYIKRLELCGMFFDPDPINYEGLSKTIDHTCEFGHVFQAKPRDVLRGKKCPFCYYWR